jgi:hypothetical protein
VAAVAPGYSDKVGSLLSFCIELGLDMFAQVGRAEQYSKKMIQGKEKSMLQNANH